MKIKYSLVSILVIYLVLSLATFFSWRNSNVNTVTGDEPHYLVMANGIGKYGSFEQTLPYSEEFRTKEIYSYGLGAPGAAPLPENTHAVQGAHGLFNVHNVGFPLLLALPFLFGGVVGAKLFAVLGSAMAVVVAWKISGIFSTDRAARYWSTLAVCVSIPLIPASSQIYPDLFAGIIALSGLYWLLTINVKRSTLTELTWAVVIVFLPWLQIKFAAACVILILAISMNIFLESRNYKKIVLLFFVALVSFAALAAYNYYAFGKLSGPYQSGALQLNKISLMVLLGLHFDQNQGFLMLNPINLVGLVSIGGLFNRNKRFALIWGFVFLSLIVPNALHPNWYGGWSFSGRFGWSAAIVFIVPVMWGLLGLARSRNKTFLVIIGLALTLQTYFFYRYAFRNVDLYNKAVTTSFDSYSIYYSPVRHWLPMLYDSTWAYDYAPNYAWLIFAMSLVISGFWISTKTRAVVFSISYALAAGCFIIFAAGLFTKHQRHATYSAQVLASQTGRLQGSIGP